MRSAQAFLLAACVGAWTRAVGCRWEQGIGPGADMGGLVYGLGIREPSLVTVAILAQGTPRADAYTQAYCIVLGQPGP